MRVFLFALKTQFIMILWSTLVFWQLHSKKEETVVSFIGCYISIKNWKWIENDSAAHYLWPMIRNCRPFFYIKYSQYCVRLFLYLLRMQSKSRICTSSCIFCYFPTSVISVHFLYVHTFGCKKNDLFFTENCT